MPSTLLLVLVTDTIMKALNKDKFITVSLELPTVIAFGGTGVLHSSREICFRDVHCATTLVVGSGPWHSGIILKKNVT